MADEIRFENFDEATQRIARPNRERLRQYLDGPRRQKFSGGPVETWADYLKLFAGVNGQTVIGEASPCYLWSPTAPANIARLAPKAKILMVLRNPVDRAFAQYAHMLSFAPASVPFREHMDAALASTSIRIGELYPFLEFGLYSGQVKRYLDQFPRRQISIHFYEDYLRAPAAMLREIFGFLEVDPDFAPERTQRHMEAKIPRSWAASRWLKELGLWQLTRKILPPGLRRMAFRKRESLTLEPASHARLIAYYRDDIKELTTLINRDLGHWLTATPSNT